MSGQACKPYPVKQRHQQICNLLPGGEQGPTPSQLRCFIPSSIGMDSQLSQSFLEQWSLLSVLAALDNRALWCCPGSSLSALGAAWLSVGLGSWVLPERVWWPDDEAGWFCWGRLEAV